VTAQRPEAPEERQHCYVPHGGIIHAIAIQNQAVEGAETGQQGCHLWIQAAEQGGVGRAATGLKGG
jgi:hypothetical protein